jgi:hypothetical protein
MKDGPTHSFVYLAATPSGEIKIGCTTNVPARMRAISGDLLFLLEGSSFRETALHFLLRKARVRGEYFEDCDLVRGFISRAKQGDYSGLIANIPNTSQRYQPAPYRCGKDADRPVRFLRESLGIGIDQLAEGCGIAISTAASSDSQTAPHYLSGRVAQYLIGIARGRGIPVNSHHLTGLYCRDLKGIISEMNRTSWKIRVEQGLAQDVFQ